MIFVDVCEVTLSTKWVGIFLRRGNSGHKRSSESEPETGPSKKHSIFQPRKLKGCCHSQREARALPWDWQMGPGPACDLDCGFTALRTTGNFLLFFSYLLGGHFVLGPQDPHGTAQQRGVQTLPISVWGWGQRASLLSPPSVFMVQHWTGCLQTPLIIPPTSLTPCYTSVATFPTAPLPFLEEVGDFYF